MNTDQIAKKINALHFPIAGQTCKEVGRIHAADTISSLIANASPNTLLVTSLNNSQLIRVAELMDVPGLCLVGGVQPSSDLIARARDAGATIMVSPWDLEQTRSLLEACLLEASMRHQ
jgi:hypothetical protein